jgi:hypothetical protein
MIRVRFSTLPVPGLCILSGETEGIIAMDETYLAELSTALRAHLRSVSRPT